MTSGLEMEQVYSQRNTWTNKTYFPHFSQLTEDFIPQKPASWSWPVRLWRSVGCWSRRGHIAWVPWPLSSLRHCGSWHSTWPSASNIWFLRSGTWLETLVRQWQEAVNSAEGQCCWSSILCAVPQGSVLGQILFILYAADVIPIAQHYGFQMHSYADDMQLYFHDKAVLW